MDISEDRNHLRVTVYRGTSGDSVTVDEYLEAHRAGSADWTPHLDLVGMDLVVDGSPLWPSWKPIGDLARMAFQFGVAAARLRAGEPALVRIGVDDFPVGGYFRFVPDDGADLVRASLLPVGDSDIGYRYPVTADGAAVGEVYERILPLRLADLGEAQDEAQLPVIDDVAAPMSRIVADLADQSEKGRELYESVGADYFLELY